MYTPAPTPAPQKATRSRMTKASRLLFIRSQLPVETNKASFNTAIKELDTIIKTNKRT